MRSPWRPLARGLAALLGRSASDRETDDEIRDFLEHATAEHVARGLTPEEARRAARLEFGSAIGIREQVRDFGWENLVETTLLDLRHAARRLRKEPGFAAVAVLTLALGVGATTAIAGAVGPILFRKLPYPSPERITMIWDLTPDGSRLEGTYGTYRELEARSHSYAALAAVKPWQAALSGKIAEPELVDAQSVTADYFEVLGVPPALGRYFEPAEDRPGGARTVVLGWALWQRRFAGDLDILGRAIDLDGRPYTVVGVMPESFENVLAPSAQLWRPLQYDISLGAAWGHHLQLVGRLRPGLAAVHARRELDDIASRPVEEFPRKPWASLSNGLGISLLHDDVTRGARPVLLALSGAVLLLLVIACVNVTNLFLARGVRRRDELALQVALGAGRARLIRQGLVESLLLAAVGGAVGMVLALIGARALASLSPPGLPRADAIGVDGRVFAFGLVITTLAGLAFGILPAWKASRVDLFVGVPGGSRTATRGNRRVRRILVMAEVSLALMLLVGSGLLWRSLQQLLAEPAGFDASRLLTLQVRTAGPRFDSDEAIWRFFEQALQSVRGIPGVRMAALTNQLPLSGDDDRYGVFIDALAADESAEPQAAFRYAVTPGYFDAMRIPLLRGRALGERDSAGAPLVAVISDSFARRRFPGSDPIGRHLRIGPRDGPAYTIVGIVGDVRQVSLALTEADAVYVTPTQWRFPDGVMSLVLRTENDPGAIASVVRRSIWAVDRDQPIVRVATMDDFLARSAAERRFALLVFEAFALSALALAAAGIFGVLAGSVAERRREMGIRSALGGTRVAIVSLVMREGLTLTGLGVAIGLAGAAFATEGLVAMLYGVSNLDPTTYAGAIAILIAVSLVASWVPAWRAARVDPVITLRAE